MLKEDKLTKRLRAASLVIAVLTLFASCANAVSPARETSAAGVADTAAGTEAAETSGSDDTADGGTISGTADDSASGESEETGAEKLWDPAARAAAIDAITAALPDHPAGEEYVLNFEGLYSIHNRINVSSSRYVTRKVNYVKEVYSGGTPSLKEKEATVTVAQNAPDGTLTVIIEYLNGGLLAVTLTPEENLFKQTTQQKNGLTVFYQQGAGLIEGVKDLLGYQEGPFTTVFDAVCEMLTGLYPAFSPDVLGFREFMPDADPPATAYMIFGDKRYWVERLLNDDGSLYRLRVGAARSNPVDYNPGKGSASLLVFAAKRDDGTVTLTAIYEHLYENSFGTRVFNFSVYSWECVDGELVPAFGSESGSILCLDDGYRDTAHQFRRCRDTAENALNKAREASEVVIIADFFSGRPVSEDSYLVSGTLPQKFEWKIAASIGLVQ